MAVQRESWDSGIPVQNDPMDPNQMTNQFGSLNVGAMPFVPNVNATSFVPGGSSGPMAYQQYSNPQQGLPPGLYPAQRPINVGHLSSSGYGQEFPGGGMAHGHVMPGYHHQPMQIDQPLWHSDQPVVSDDVDSWEDRATDETKPVGAEVPATNDDDDTPLSTTGVKQEETTVRKLSSENLPSVDMKNLDSLSDESSDRIPPSEVDAESELLEKTFSPESQPKSKDRQADNGVAMAAVSQPKIRNVFAPKKADSDKENVNLVFIGHVDAGKSTIGGHIMYLTGQVDKRTLEKYEREAKEKNRETWYLSWALDTNQEERDKGKTVETGRAYFETEKKRFTILDAPGHAGFVPNMISGAAQGDIGILVISARKGEFETGFERRGQTREHAMLVKIAGVKYLVVLINKMDDPTVKWSEERYEECKTKLTPFLKTVGFNPKTDINFIPVSGLSGTNLKDTVDHTVCPWYKGTALIKFLDDMPTIPRSDSSPLRMPVVDKYKDMGILMIGIIHAGTITKGQQLAVMPNRTPVEVLSVMRNDEEILAGYSGDNLKIKLKGVEEEDISPGFVLCDPSEVCHTGKLFDAQIIILEHKSIICAGYSAVLHIHTAVEEVQIVSLIGLYDKKTGKKMPGKPRFVKQDQVVVARMETAGIICLETFKDFPRMARFILRDEGKTIAIGKVLKLM